MTPVGVLGPPGPAAVVTSGGVGSTAAAAVVGPGGVSPLLSQGIKNNQGTYAQCQNSIINELDILIFVEFVEKYNIQKDVNTYILIHKGLRILISFTYIRPQKSIFLFLRKQG